MQNNTGYTQSANFELFATIKVSNGLPLLHYVFKCSILVPCKMYSDKLWAITALATILDTNIYLKGGPKCQIWPRRPTFCSVCRHKREVTASHFFTTCSKAPCGFHMRCIDKLWAITARENNTGHTQRWPY